MAPKPKLAVDDATLDLFAAMLDAGLSYREMARHVGCDKDTASKYVRSHFPTTFAERAARPEPPRILVVDIETMANKCWAWGVWQQNIAPSQIIQHKRTISFAAKWYGEKPIHFYSEFHDGRAAMVAAAWGLMNSADAIVGYNSQRFDTRHLNTEFKREGYDPPSAYQHIDLLKITRREFQFGHNKLESVAQELGLGKKREHEGFELWKKCDAGDPDAWKRMRAYNRNDVKLTERLFNDYRAWIPLRGTQSQKRLRKILEAV